MKSTIPVIATGLGYDGLQIRNTGDTFDMPEGSAGSWFEPVAETKPSKLKNASSDLV